MLQDIQAGAGKTKRLNECVYFLDEYNRTYREHPKREPKGKFVNRNLLIPLLRPKSQDNEGDDADSDDLLC